MCHCDHKTHSVTRAIHLFHKPSYTIRLVVHYCFMPWTGTIARWWRMGLLEVAKRTPWLGKWGRPRNLMTFTPVLFHECVETSLPRSTTAPVHWRVGKGWVGRFMCATWRCTVSTWVTYSTVVPPSHYASKLPHKMRPLWLSERVVFRHTRRKTYFRHSQLAPGVVVPLLPRPMNEVVEVMRFSLSISRSSSRLRSPMARWWVHPVKLSRFVWLIWPAANASHRPACKVYSWKRPKILISPCLH